ncbi:MAG TPA: DEAD/DEAH box helicase [Pseudomonadota bacterium]|nr:DEAD/DEAH box helicase [Pseudomonadota bacterium]
MSETPGPASSTPFAELGLAEPVLAALRDVGYETPSPIQAATIPLLMAGRDVLGQAQTGTGKTAAFALPILSRIDLARATTQALVLAPTRELAIQVAEAFQRYAAHLRGFHVLPIYGGQSYGPQLGGLRRGAHVVVGTPGRVIDHLDRGSLDLSTLSCVVLDEADEMLRMGFIDAVESILQKAPAKRQTALFSATMPAPIRRIADRHLRDPATVMIEAKTRTATNVRQRYWAVSGLHKLDALTRILEAEPFDAMIVFARTKQATEELAGRLQARGFSAAAINGDIAQPMRERAIAQLRDGQLDILVATDVAARGLDVERVSHVLNYDIPYDTESYVHRIGRTGRAGRSGEAILFVTPREQQMLRVIERATRQPIERMELPSVEAVNDRRVSKFMQRISDTRAAGDLGSFQVLVETYEREHDVPAIEIAAALARIAHGNKPLLLEPPPRKPAYDKPAYDKPAYVKPAYDKSRDSAPSRPGRAPPPSPSRRKSGPSDDFDPDSAAPTRPKRPRASDAGMQTYRVEVGHSHGVKPGNLVGAIANEAALDSQHIGRIDIHDDYSLVDLPRDLPAESLQHLHKVWVAGQRLRIAPAQEADRNATPVHKKSYARPSGPKPHRKGPRAPR